MEGGIFLRVPIKVNILSFGNNYPLDIGEVNILSYNPAQYNSNPYPSPEMEFYPLIRTKIEFHPFIRKERYLLTLRSSIVIDMLTA